MQRATARIGREIETLALTSKSSRLVKATDVRITRSIKPFIPAQPGPLVRVSSIQVEGFPSRCQPHLALRCDHRERSLSRSFVPSFSAALPAATSREKAVFFSRLCSASSRPPSSRLPSVVAGNKDIRPPAGRPAARAAILRRDEDLPPFQEAT